MYKKRRKFINNGRQGNTMANDEYPDETVDLDKVDEDPQEQLDNDGMQDWEAGYQEGSESAYDENEEEKEEKPLDDFPG